MNRAIIVVDFETSSFKDQRLVDDKVKEVCSSLTASLERGSIGVKSEIKVVAQAASVLSQQPKFKIKEENLEGLVFRGGRGSNISLGKVNYPKNLTQNFRKYLDKHLEKHRRIKDENGNKLFSTADLQAWADKQITEWSNGLMSKELYK